MLAHLYESSRLADKTLNLRLSRTSVDLVMKFSFLLLRQILSQRELDEIHDFQVILVHYVDMRAVDHIKADCLLQILTIFCLALLLLLF